MIGSLLYHLPQTLIRKRFASPSQFQTRAGAEPVVLVRTTDQQVLRSKLAQSTAGTTGCIRRADLVDAAVGAVPVGVGIGMGGALVVEVADVERAVGAEAHIGRAAPRVVRIPKDAAVRRHARCCRLGVIVPPGDGVARESCRR